MQVTLPDETAHVAFGETLGRLFQGRGRLYLYGDLGAGKTTLTRGILRAYGYRGAVKSPTYTLVEPYELGEQRIYHLDLYRLGDPEELEFIGGRDVLADDALCVIEWPGRGSGWLPPADVQVTLDVEGDGRRATLDSQTPRGEERLTVLAQALREEAQERS